MSDPNTKRRAYLLAGGRSQRYGSDKALARVDGQPNLLRLARLLVQSSWSVTIVAQHDADYADLGLRCIGDFVENAGPLAGVITALADCESAGVSWCLIGTCDSLAWETDWGQKFLDRSADQNVCIVCLSSPSFMPFPGLYSTAMLPRAYALWQQGVRSMRDLHMAFENEIATIDCDTQRLPAAFNTPDELRLRYPSIDESTGHPSIEPPSDRS